MSGKRFKLMIALELLNLFEKFFHDNSGDSLYVILGCILSLTVFKDVKKR